ncbi:RecQ family ATP-dependent DNA helicase [Candidatus Enterococcus murrayae]|uniref:ATP-dependent DNA helicase RecQ n=1 Tax=Candidatus Enterococcus murrayae TaxID=2815321 RepID=A0ABS3HFH0_9ENTE|nr:ATP-dependent DNA helicase RecQ [Enterococcus sp. MJM16]MBO0452182.1 ATP-dependent DNA helicase RecQ [Enterococcus sp. MJM16]
MELIELLKTKFNYDHFRPGQQEIIESLLSGNSVLGMLPTGTGKSLCYQLPGYLLEGTVIIISPLISLMEDQVTQLQRLGEKRAVALNSVLSSWEKQLVLSEAQKYKFIFMSPEMFLTANVQKTLQAMKLSLVVVDEAHCISQWGIDFRPEYLKLADGIKKVNVSLVLALTATATKSVRQDIQRLLFNDEAQEFIYSVDRPNISFFVYQGDKLKKLQELVESLAGSGIVYCATRKKVEELYKLLKQTHAVAYYHGGLSGQERRMLQQQFLAGDLQLLIATNAFGMGINKDNIRFVIHYDLPDSPENYLQEVGRAGRDGQPSQAILLYEEGDEHIHHFLQEQTNQSKKLFEIKQKITDLVFEDPLIKKWEQFFPNQESRLLDLLSKRGVTKKVQLKKMLDYISTANCRRKFLVSYFDETLHKKNSNCCDNDGATLAIKISKEIPSETPFTWQKIVQKIFKNAKKD